jgi:glucose/arabinose dehydrogenase
MFQSRSCWRRVCLRVFAVMLVALGARVPLSAATLPAGFTEGLVASGLSNPTAMQFAPDGRLFVAQQGGALRVIRNGVLLATPFVTIAVDAAGERGLLGVAFDPDFGTGVGQNQYVYVYYTVPSGPGVTVHNRISRFTANGDVALAGSELPIVELDNLSSATNHNGGAIDFSPDGKLYVAVGDNANTSFPQSLSTRHGKMLRYNPDGSIPTDNPASFPGIAGTTAGIYRAIWAVGLRNPFTFSVNPGPSPLLMVNDVGQGAWEEMSPGSAGVNFGWPATEGDFNPVTYPNFTRPRYAYANDASTCAITGGTFYGPSTPNFPSAYQGMYFFADYCGGWIRYIDPTQVFAWPALAVPTTFATGISLPVDLKVGPDGALYYLARGSGSVFRVQYGSSAPTITSHPANRTVSVGQSATFSVTAGGTPPFTYQWQRNGVDISGASGASYTRTNAQLADSGARFRVNVSNSAGNLFSNEATLTVTTNVAPVAAITAPAANLLYTGGMTVTFAGTGTDPDGAPTTLPPSAFSWRIDFHHDTHTHPFLPATAGTASLSP